MPDDYPRIWDDSTTIYEEHSPEPVEEPRPEKPFFIKFLIVLAGLSVVSAFVLIILLSLGFNPFSGDDPKSSDDNVAITATQGPGLFDVTTEPTTAPTPSASPSPSTTSASPSPKPSPTTSKVTVKPTRTQTTKPDNGSGPNPFTGGWVASGNKMAISIASNGHATRTTLIGGKYAMSETTGSGKTINDDLSRYDINRGATQFYVLDNRNNIKETVDLATFRKLIGNSTFYADNPDTDDDFFQIERKSSNKIVCIDYDGDETTLYRY